MKKRLRIEPEATEELRAAVRWYEERSPGLGADFLAEVNSVLERIQRFLGIGAPAPGVPQRLGVRVVSVGRFPYSVAFLQFENLYRRHPTRTAASWVLAQPALLRGLQAALPALGFLP